MAWESEGEVPRQPAPGHCGEYGVAWRVILELTEQNGALVFSPWTSILKGRRTYSGSLDPPRIKGEGVRPQHHRNITTLPRREGQTRSSEGRRLALRSGAELPRTWGGIWQTRYPWILMGEKWVVSSLPPGPSPSELSWVHLSANVHPSSHWRPRASAEAVLRSLSPSLSCCYTAAVFWGHREGSWIFP